MSKHSNSSAFEYENVSVHYTIQGSGRPVLFLPGGGVSPYVYRKIIKDLANSYKIIAVDLPCFGKSSVPQDTWGLKEYALCIDALLKSINIDQIIVIGHSLGGGIALAMSIHGEKVTQTIAIDSAGINPNFSEALFRYKFFIQKSWYNLTAYKDFYVFYTIAKDFLLNRFKKWKQWNQILKISKACLLSDLSGLDTITTPTLLLWGNDDEIFPLPIAKKLQKTIPTSHLQTTKGNHDWILFNPQELTTIVRQWLTDKNYPPTEQNQL